MNIFLFLLLFTANKSQAEILFFLAVFFFYLFHSSSMLTKNSSFMATGKGFMGEIEKIIIKKKHQQTSHEKTNVKHRKT